MSGKVKCGECRYFVRDGKCNFLTSEAGRDPKREFSIAPFWVWSDCYSDREQVRSGVESCCLAYDAKASPITSEGEKL